MVRNERFELPVPCSQSMCVGRYANSPKGVELLASDSKARHLFLGVVRLPLVAPLRF